RGSHRGTSQEQASSTVRDQRPGGSASLATDARRGAVGRAEPRSVRGPRTGQPLPRSGAATAGRDASRAPPRPRYASRMTRVLVLNGPNLGRLGVREPEVYGHATLADLRSACESWAAELGLEADVRQTDDESQIVAWLHEAVDT